MLVKATHMILDLEVAWFRVEVLESSISYKGFTHAMFFFIFYDYCAACSCRLCKDT